jgi:hypothetical protein
MDKTIHIKNKNGKYILSHEFIPSEYENTPKLPLPPVLKGHNTEEQSIPIDLKILESARRRAILKEQRQQEQIQAAIQREKEYQKQYKEEQRKQESLAKQLFHKKYGRNTKYDPSIPIPSLS